MRFGILGGLEVRDDDDAVVDIAGAQARALLALLVIAGRQTVPVASLVDDLWADDPPPSANATLQSYVSRLRAALSKAASANPVTITFAANGYRLDVEGATIDVAEFERLATLGRRQLDAGDAAAARAALVDALGWWRGPALQEFGDHAWASGVAARLEERRRSAREDLAEAELELGHLDTALDELARLRAADPLRERTAALCATALYRAGRQADALRELAEVRHRLVDQLGVDPSPELAALELQILQHGPALRPTAPVAAPPEPAALPWVSDARHVAGLEPPLVGRVRERANLGRALAEALAGRTAFALVEGEAGIGKTRLVEDVASEAARAGADVLWGRSYDTANAMAFGPWLGPLRALATTGGPLPDRNLQDLLDRLVAPRPDDDWLTSLSDAQRHALSEAVALLLESSAARTPVVILLDDAHWADLASLELLEFLGARIFSARLLVLITVRVGAATYPDALVRALATTRRGNGPQLALAPIGREEGEQLVRQAVGRKLSRRATGAILDRAEGNPFFIRELAQLVDRDQAISDDELAGLSDVPISVRDVVRRRLAALPPPTREVLEQFAALGREASIVLAARALGTTAASLVATVEPALRAGLLRQAPGSSSAVRFSHALVHDVVVDDMSMLRRASAHLAAADAIESLGPVSADQVEIVAEHLWRAAVLAPPERVVAALERAADVAARRMAPGTAAQLLERALELRQSTAIGALDPAGELESMQRMIAMRRVTSGYVLAAGHLNRVRELADHVGNYDVYFEVLYTEWGSACVSGRLGAATQLSAELTAVAARDGDSLVQAIAEGAAGITALHHGGFRDACHHLDRSMAVLAHSIEATMAHDTLQEPRVLMAGFQAFVRELAGAADPATASLSPLAEAQIDPFSRMVLLTFEAIRANFASDLETAFTVSKSGIEEGTAQSYEFFTAGCRAAHGECLVRTGSIDDGLRHLDQAIGEYERIGALTFSPWYSSQGAIACYSRGDIEEAARWLERAERVLDVSREMWTEPGVAVVRALLAGLRGVSAAEVEAELEAVLARTSAAGARGLATRLREQLEQIGALGR